MTDQTKRPTAPDAPADKPSSDKEEPISKGAEEDREALAKQRIAAAASAAAAQLGSGRSADLSALLGDGEADQPASAAETRSEKSTPLIEDESSASTESTSTATTQRTGVEARHRRSTRVRLAVLLVFLLIVVAVFFYVRDQLSDTPDELSMSTEQKIAPSQSGLVLSTPRDREVELRRNQSEIERTSPGREASVADGNNLVPLPEDQLQMIREALAPEFDPIGTQSTDVNPSPSGPVMPPG